MCLIISNFRNILEVHWSRGTHILLRSGYQTARGSELGSPCTNCLEFGCVAWQTRTWYVFVYRLHSFTFQYILAPIFTFVANILQTMIRMIANLIYLSLLMRRHYLDETVKMHRWGANLVNSRFVLIETAARCACNTVDLFVCIFWLFYCFIVPQLSFVGWTKHIR